ncbi:ABC transporter ATP-binding protein [Protaetiibacter intestinalis]|uniref:ABC transporter ATP-binding protein n=1 Tax=Protaetiibacter intestinalis TaxID=2419774 RepID=A0A387B6C8_9MICO|nr:ABC transporter ATP-binding protein [Protaetiibacter intestinalis]AYF97308.1 ABC transporter ATP-binding protein [Protaetiibacter intestinalis]
MSTDTALVVDDVSKHFGGLKAMRHVSLTLGVGERISVIGTNGAGKSTLFNCIAGTFPASSGRIELFGEDVTRMSASRRARRGLARTFQTSRLFEQLTAAENVFIALGGNEFRGGLLRPSRFGRERWDRVERLLERVGLAGRDETVVADLSHGEQRQLELAMALALQPRLLMLDEPAAGFSPAERVHLTTLLRELPQEISLLLIEHDMDIALAVATRVIVMHDGEKILEGTPDEIRASERVREIYLGGSVADVA